MKTTWKLIVFAVTLVLVSGCTREKGEIPKEIGAKEVEYLGGKYNASIVAVESNYKGERYTRNKINYTKGWKSYSVFFDESMRPSLEWIKLNTPEDAGILCWWDYGGMIEGYTGRDVVIKAPSRKMLRTVAMYASLSDEEFEKAPCENCEPHERISTVAEALTADDPQKTAEIMGRYDADYLFMDTSDKDKLYAILFALDKNTDDYIKQGELTEKGANTVLGRALGKGGMESLELVYSDDDVRIYKTI